MYTLNGGGWFLSSSGSYPQVFMVGRVGTVVPVGGYSLGSFSAHLVYLDQ